MNVKGFTLAIHDGFAALGGRLKRNPNLYKYSLAVI
jgi:hypothetical protein